MMNDICRNRHRGNAQSIAANPTAEAKASVRARVLEAVRTLDTFTLADVAALLDKPLNTISGRISELKAAKVIIGTGKRRGKFEVYQLREPSGAN